MRGRISAPTSAPSPDGYLVADAARLLGVYQSDVDRMIRHGELRATKVGLRRYIDPNDLEAAILWRAGVQSAAEALDRIATLQAENDQLRAAAREAQTEGRMSAEAALAALTLDEALAVLGRMDPDDWDDRIAISRAAQTVQRQIDREDLAAFTGKRPRGVPPRAKHRTIATGIGPVDIWYWQTSRGRWRASYGGPRGPWPGSRDGAETAPAAIKWAGQQARATYGKPERRSSARLRFLVLERDGFACQYCGRKAPEVELHVDHVNPVAAGGSSAPDNLVTACRDCNLGKSSRSL